MKGMIRFLILLFLGVQICGMEKQKAEELIKADTTELESILSDMIGYVKGYINNKADFDFSVNVSSI